MVVFDGTVMAARQWTATAPPAYAGRRGGCLLVTRLDRKIT